MRTDNSRAAEGLIFKSLNKEEGGPVDPKRSEASRLAWESRDRGAGGAEAPGDSIDSKLGKLQHGGKVALPGIKSGKDVLQGYTATYVGDQKGNRTYRVLDPHDRFAWNLSHKRIMAAVADKDFQATDVEKAEAPGVPMDASERSKKAWETRHAALGLRSTQNEGGVHTLEAHGTGNDVRRKTEAMMDHLTGDGFKRIGVKQPETDTHDRRTETYHHPDGRKAHVSQTWVKAEQHPHYAAGGKPGDEPSHLEVVHVAPGVKMGKPKGAAAKDIDDAINRIAKQDDSDEVKACVKRKIPIIAGENPGWEQDQVVAVAFSMCREASGEKSLGETLLPPWVHNKALRVRDDSRP